MNAEKRYKVVFRGDLEKGISPAIVKRRLKEQFRRLPDSFFVNSSGSLFVVYVGSTVSESSLISFFLKKVLTKVLH